MLFAFLAALLVGVGLGLLGSGGSILTVPILHYGLGWDEKAAVAGSLFVVGAVSLLGAINLASRGRVHWPSVIVFGIPGVLGTWGGAYLSRWVPGSVQLALFACVVLLAAWLLRRPVADGERISAPRARWKVGLDGLGVGALTGLVGVGGGFLIVPALVLLGGLELFTAVGTSLAIVAAKSLAGFGEYRAVLDELHLVLDWDVLWIFVALSAAGSLVGGRLGQVVSAERLKATFSTMLVLLAVGILCAETFGVGDRSAEVRAQVLPEDAGRVAASATTVHP